MTIWFVTRHPGALEWARRRGIGPVTAVAHLDLEHVAPGDDVLGTLPVHLAAEVCARSGRYFHLSMEIPHDARGQELTASDMETFGARLEEYTIVKGSGSFG